MAGKILITGGAGFIGAHLVEALLERGLNGVHAEICCLVRDPSKLEARLRERVTVLTGSLNDIGRTISLPPDCTHVFHLAAHASFAGAPAAAAENISGTAALLNALSSQNSLQRFIFVSSIGAVDRTPNDDCSAPLTEESPANPLTEYGRSKLRCEELVKRSGLPFVIARPTWVYGPGMRENSHIRVLIERASRDSFSLRVRLPGRVSVVYVADLVESLLVLAAHPESAGKTYFISDGKPVSLGELFRLIGKIVGSRSGTISFGSGLVSALRSWRRFLPFSLACSLYDVLCASPAELMKLGWRPQVPLEMGLITTAAWSAKTRRGQTAECRALVTGAASGLGKALSIQLGCRGYDLLLVDRNEPALMQLHAAIGGTPIVCDIGDDNQRSALLRSLDKRLAIVINCAGIGERAPFADSELAQQRKIIDVNITAALELSHAALRIFRERGGGTLVNVASSAAFQPLPFMASYVASKAFIFSFTEALRGEMSSTSGVRVLTVCPSGIATGFQQAAGVKVDPREKLLDPADAARIIAARLRRGSPLLFIGLRVRLMDLVARLLPHGVLLKVWAKLMSSRR